MISRTFSSGFRGQLALGISVIFSPFLVPILTAMCVVQKYAGTRAEALLWLTIMVVFVTLLPISGIVALYWASKVSDLHLQAKEERLIPLSFTLASMIVGTIILHRIDASRELVWAGIAYIANSVVFSAITPLWKISFHTSVTTGCLMVLVFLVNSTLGWLFLVVPLIAWARVYRKRHTLLQTVVGTLLAVVNTSLIFYVKALLSEPPY